VAQPSRIEAILAGDRRVRAELLQELHEVDGDERAGLLNGLARAAAGGSRPALDTLITATNDLRLAEPAVRRLILDPDDVADVVQDVLIRVSWSIRNFRGEARYTTWLHQVARNTAVDFLRRRRERDSVDEEDAIPDAVHLSSMVATRKSLQQLVEQLPDLYREAVVLRDVQQLSYEEVARRLDLKLNSAKSRIVRGRALLANLIHESGFERGGSHG
jgi:RNA polymerase sigma-70 factor (ECF subfamily)